MYDDRLALLERTTEKALQSQEDRIKSLGASTEKAIENISRKLDGITQILETLVRVEQQQIHTASRIDGLARGHDKQEIFREKQELRLQVIEQHMPGLLEVRAWALRGIFSGIAMIFAGVCAIVLARFK